MREDDTMKTQDKISILDDYDKIDELTDQHFLIIKQFASDKNEFVRSRCAALLSNFNSSDSMSLLLKLINDADSLVRTEAYDSLSNYVNDLVEQSLRNAIQTEVDDMARAYAIISWGEVASSLKYNTAENINFVKHQKLVEKVDICSLNYCYVQYIFGERVVLEEILSYLKNTDYHIRCAAISILYEIMDMSNNVLIKEAIIKLLDTEESEAVKDRAISLLNNI